MTLSSHTQQTPSLDSRAPSISFHMHQISTVGCTALCAFSMPSHATKALCGQLSRYPHLVPLARRPICRIPRSNCRFGSAQPQTLRCHSVCHRCSPLDAAIVVSARDRPGPTRFLRDQAQQRRDVQRMAGGVTSGRACAACAPAAIWPPVPTRGWRQLRPGARPRAGAASKTCRTRSSPCGRPSRA